MEYWHITISSTRRMTICPTEAALRKAVRCIARVCAESLVLFCVVDDHVHVVVVCQRGNAGRIARALLLALRRIASTQLLPGHSVRVESRKHLEWLVRYLLDQPAKHGIASTHAGLYTGSCFQDLVGARLVSSFATRIFRALPRLRKDALCRIVGLPDAVLVPATHEELRVAGVARIVAAAERVVAAEESLDTRAPSSVAARGAASHLVDAAGLSRSELVRASGVSARTIRRQSHELCDVSVARAICVQVSLERALTDLRLVTMPSSVRSPTYGSSRCREAVLRPLTT